jgi:hypothetical protein
LLSTTSRLLRRPTDDPQLNRSRRPGDYERGQILVLFAGGAFALLAIAALAFDVGMMLVERRDQQNAADAAALAGARFVLESANYDGSCAAAPGDNKAVRAACDLATDNDFVDADADENVIVHIPPDHGRYVGFPGFIEVQIESTRPSVFGGIVGRAVWPVGVFAAAGNQSNLTFPFSMLALNETKCKAMHFSGSGEIDAYGNIHSNSTGSDCEGDDKIGLSRSGGATVDIFADDATCRAVGSIQDQGSGYMTCTPAPNSFMLPDPLRFLSYPDKPALPTQVMDPVGHTHAYPDYCPGATPASKEPSESNPRTCDLAPTGGFRDLAWILYPGLYPGGIEVDQGVTAYLMPGIYWIGGGGLKITTGGSVISIATQADATPDPADATWGGGVMFFNSTLPNEAAGPFVQDGSSATMKLKKFHVDEPDPLAIYNDIVIFQDRSVTETVTLNGSASTTEVEGIIYVPEGQVKLNGNGGTLIVDQIIADNYLIDGTGEIQVLKRTGVDAIITGVGLVD